MNLFHVSMDILNKIEVFEPRIPKESIRMVDEDGITPRVCVSETIQGCFSAMPSGGSSFGDNFVDYGEGLCSCVFRVYEFHMDDIPAENIVTSQELFKSGRVLDAEDTKEYWIINQSIKPTKTYLIQVSDFEEEDCDLITYEDLVRRENGEDIFEDCIDGHFTIIDEIEYVEVSEKDVSPVVEKELLIQISQSLQKEHPELLIYDPKSIFYNPDYKPDINTLGYVKE